MEGVKAFGDGGNPLSMDYQYSISAKSRIIYQTLILSIIISIVSLPFIKVPVSVKATGVIQAETERFDLVIPVNGKMIQVFVRDNQKIVRGDTLLILDAFLSSYQNRLLEQRQILLRYMLGDIRKALKTLSLSEIGESVTDFQTDQYTASWQQFLHELQAKETIKRQRERDFTRFDYLYNSRVITLSEFEKSKFEYDQAGSEYQLLVDQYTSKLHADARVYHEELRNVSAETAMTREQQKMFTVISPYNGSIQNLKPPQIGAYYFANQKVAEISPDGKLWAFCFVRATDIGRITVGQKVKLQVDAYNYNVWGSLPAKVDEIFDDVTLVNSVPLFKIKCSLGNAYVDLDGFRAYLKKGMSFSAHFNTGSRTLFSLLWDRAEQLVDPNIAPN